MYRQPSRRRVLLQRIAVYGLMTIVTVGLVTVLIFVMLGYRFNRTDGTIQQGGLVQFESIPSGADVNVDGSILGGHTSTKTTLGAGQHFMKMERAGYRTWQKAVEVTKGNILWLDYVRLIPTELSPASVASFGSVSSTAASPDDKWMAIKEDASTHVIRLANLGSDEVRLTNLELPASSYTLPVDSKPHSFTIENWDLTSRYLLVSHRYDDSKLEWIVVDSQNSANTKNITTLLGVNASKVMFSNGNSTVLYVLADNSIRKVDLNAETLSGPLLSNVADFSLYDRSRLTYVTFLDPTTKKRSVGYLDEGASASRTLRSYSDDGTTPLHLQIDKYFNDMYAAVSYGDTIEVLVGDLPRSDGKQSLLLKAVGTMTLPSGVQYLSTKNSGRFVTAQAGSTYVVYDHELKKMTTTTTKGTLGIAREFDWLDDYMLWNDNDGMLRFYEFDGANQHDIMPIVAGQSVTLSSNGKYVYGITKSKDGATFQLERVRLIL